MEKKQYQWKSCIAFNYKNIDAQQVGNEIESLGESIEPKQLVDYAREHKDSELHKTMEWNDTEAAEKYRLYQARQVLTSLIIVQDSAEKAEQPRSEVRVFQKPYKEKYQHIETIVKNEDSYQNLLKKARMELAAFKVKYSFLKELKNILDLIP